jgi:hypothetical protein
MSDPTALLQAAQRSTLKADAPLIALFNPGPVKVYDVPPVNGKPPYIVIGEDQVAPLSGEGFDGGRVFSTIHVFSLTDPPGLTEAKQIGAAIPAALSIIAGVDGFRLDFDPTAADARYKIEPDGQTTHGVIVVGWTASPQ